MYTDCTNRVINFYDFIKEFNCKYNDNTCNCSNEQCLVIIDYITACCDSYQSGQCAVHCHTDIRFSITYPGNNQGNKCCCCCREVCGHGNVAKIVGCCCGRSTVKSEPAEPEDKDTKCSKRKVMTRNSNRFSLFCVFSDTRSDHFCTGKGTQTTDHMNCSRSCKIMEPDLA